MNSKVKPLLGLLVYGMIPTLTSKCHVFELVKSPLKMKQKKANLVQLSRSYGSEFNY